MRIFILFTTCSFVQFGGGWWIFKICYGSKTQWPVTLRSGTQTNLHWVRGSSIKKDNSCGHVRKRGGGEGHHLIGFFFFFLKEKNMQNFLKRKNRHLEAFQVILNLVLQNHTFYAILNLFICISKNYFEEKTNFLSASANTGFAVRAWVVGTPRGKRFMGRGPGKKSVFQCFWTSFIIHQ